MLTARPLEFTTEDSAFENTSCFFQIENLQNWCVFIYNSDIKLYTSLLILKKSIIDLWLKDGQ